MSLQDKKIIVAVTGSIAAYKTPHLVRLLVKAGASVRVIVTAAATHFVTPLSLSTVSKHPVLSDINDGENWNNHVELGLWADAMLVAPCTANTLARLANGICDSLLAAVYLSARCPVCIAPAMDADMWVHPSTVSNLQRLHSYGNHIIPVAHGELASGLIGDGRMAEPEAIADYLNTLLNAPTPLAGLRALVTAGPTYERLDPVRFIGNFSTGKMGIAIAEALATAGAAVTLVCGPTHLRAHHKGVNTIAVESAEQMYDACMAAYPGCKIAIMAAAVADYRPETIVAEKIKKNGTGMELSLVKTKDILHSLGEIKQPGQTLIGFALETDNELANAESKLLRKNADAIVLNSLRDPGAGFGHDTNKVTVITKNGTVHPLQLAEKTAIAKELVDFIIEMRHAENTI